MDNILSTLLAFVVLFMGQGNSAYLVPVSPTTHSAEVTAGMDTPGTLVVNGTEYKCPFDDFRQQYRCSTGRIWHPSRLFAEVRTEGAWWMGVSQYVYPNALYLPVVHR